MRGAAARCPDDPAAFRACHSGRRAGRPCTSSLDATRSGRLTRSAPAVPLPDRATRRVAFSCPVGVEQQCPLGAHRRRGVVPCEGTGDTRLDPDTMNDASDDGRSTSGPFNPYPGYKAMRSACPVRAVASGSHGRDSYLVTGYAEARQALCDVRLSKDTAAFFAGKGSKRRHLHLPVHHGSHVPRRDRDPRRCPRTRRPRCGQPRSGALHRTGPARPGPGGDRSSQLRPRHPPLRRRTTRESRSAHRPPRGPDPLPRHPARRTGRPVGLAADQARSRAEFSTRSALEPVLPGDDRRNRVRRRPRSRNLVARVARPCRVGQGGAASAGAAR